MMSNRKKTKVDRLEQRIKSKKFRAGENKNHTQTARKELRAIFDRQRSVVMDYYESIKDNINSEGV
jgi:ribosome-binding protein aMBF1 (putative translation factor)